MSLTEELLFNLTILKQPCDKTTLVKILESLTSHWCTKNCKISPFAVGIYTLDLFCQMDNRS
jgi:hypothetical protein